MKNPKKISCWEFKRCGRELGGDKVHELGVCPASTEAKLDGVHEGDNSGRACWAIAGSMCNGRVQGSFAHKYGNCVICDFFKKVKEEEGKDFTLSSVLLKKLEEE